MKNIGFKLTSIMLCVILLGIVLTVGISMVISGTTIARESLDKVVYNTESEAYRIDSWLREKMAITTTLSNVMAHREEDIINLSSFLSDNPHFAYDETIQPTFREVLMEHEAVFEVFMGFTNGRAQTGSGYIFDYFARRGGLRWTSYRRPWYQLALSDPTRAHVTDPYVDAQTGLWCISVVRAVRGGELGALGLDIFVTELADIVLAITLGGPDSAMLLGDTGDIFVHQNEAYSPGVTGRFWNINQIAAGAYAGVWDAIQRGETTVRARDSNGEWQHYTASPISSSGWYLVTAIPTSVVNQPIVNVVMVVVPLTLIILVVGGLLIYTTIFKVVGKPLNNYLNETKQAQLQAEAASKAKSAFLAAMSHEIRTPMNAVIGIAQIEMQKELTEETAAAFEKIERSGSSLLGIINDILDMSKIETGKLTLDPMEYETASMLNDTVQLNIVRLGSKHIDFIFEIDETLPSMLYGDEIRIKQILNNLLSNAIKYTEEGHVKFSVKHSQTDDVITLRFSVEDTGQGIKPEDKARLFTAYSRFNTEANRTTEGAGLGLNIAKNLAEMMGGTISAESEYGKGSTFYVEIKQQPVDCPAIGADAAKHLREFTFVDKRRFKKLSITPMPDASALVVDDVETNLYVASGMLSLYRFKTETAHSGFEALEKISGGSTYDIIFMDHMMPKMDGIETTKKLRSLGYASPIIALTANALVGNAEMFRQNGFDDFLSKPIAATKLDDILLKWIPAEKQSRPCLIEQPDKAPEAPAIEGIDTAKGVALSGGSVGSYHKTLAVFQKDAAKIAGEISEYAENLPLYTTHVHALCSACANIGAEKLSAEADALEKAALKNDLEFIKNHHENFVAAIRKLIADIDAVISENAPESDEHDISALHNLLANLRIALVNFNMSDIDDASEKLQAFTSHPEISEALNGILQNILIGKYKQAVTQIDDLINRE